jgi:hypothetical protein
VDLILTPNDGFTMSDGTMATSVKANSASSVVFKIVAAKVGLLDLQVTATGRSTGRPTTTDQVNRKIISRVSTSVDSCL